MELWIRSQDKEILLPVDKPLIYDYSSSGVRRIVYKESASYITQVGAYKSRERILEILNEIEQRLLDLQTLEIAPNSYQTIKRNINCVYDMPQE